MALKHACRSSGTDVLGWRNCRFGDTGAIKSLIVNSTVAIPQDSFRRRLNYKPTIGLGIIKKFFSGAIG
jgi:hypothetical protein